MVVSLLGRQCGREGRIAQSEALSPPSVWLVVPGPAQSPLVIHCHGAPSSRFELAHFDQAFAELVAPLR